MCTLACEPLLWRGCTLSASLDLLSLSNSWKDWGTWHAGPITLFMLK